ncbi:hypothetical protein CJF32_00003262 [Rutstroemia sp. NJR-2017a WRK4]|nr:hypothetical protein CJF32_00003262 [Rutstroemia sp. NJR-2017a WRK4]
MQEQGSANSGPANDDDGCRSSEGPIDHLCARCKAIDFYKILCDEQEIINHPQEPVTVIDDLGPVIEWDTDSCAFCKALFTMVSLEGELGSSREYALSSMLSQRPDAHIALHIATHYPLLDSLPQRILLVMEDLYRYGPSYKVLIPQTRDNFNGWLSVCQNIHTEICSSKNRETTEYLQVIDCKNRKLVPADSLPYVTLSYVWGVNQNPQDLHYSKNLGHRLPPTIEDAIDVTLKLGYQYLWVDRYCINQQGTGNEAIIQIQQMDSIYKNSDFTIIAAAGSDPSYGLPGVSRSRLQQAVVRLGQLELVNPGSIANAVLQRSRWSTRGWTFQEAYLSKRRIVFTDEQVYYECNGMYSYESFNVPLQNMHDEGSQILEQRYFRSRGRHGPNVGKIIVFPGGVTEGSYRPYVILDHIHDFSRRTFTYPSDKLIGFLGILKEFETWPHRVRNIWGSPISPESESYKVTDFLNSMIWLCREAKRIFSLPSWSWVGWTG